MFIIPSPSQGEEKDRRTLEGLTPFLCELCDYPVFPSWKFCPSCGSQILWAKSVMEESTNAPTKT